MSDFLHSSPSTADGKEKKRVTHSAPKLVSQCLSVTTDESFVIVASMLGPTALKASPLQPHQNLAPSGSSSSSSKPSQISRHSPIKRTPPPLTVHPTCVRSLVQQGSNQNLCVARFASHQSLKLKINCRHRLPSHPPCKPQSTLSAASRAGTSGSLWARLTNVLV